MTWIAGLATLGSGCRKTDAALSFAPALFDVRETSALVWVRSSQPARLQAEVAERENFETSFRTRVVATSPLSDLTGVLALRGLRPGTRYHVKVVGAGASKALGPALRLDTPPRRADRVRFAWSADMYESARPFVLLDELLAQAPDFFLLLGDTTYADWQPHPASDLAGFRRKHRRVRADPHLQKLLGRLPVVATWDDHEVQNNFDASHPLINAGRLAFQEYWPAEAGPARKWGLYRSFIWGELIEVFVLDTRSFRRAEETRTRTLLGPNQLDWLLRGLEHSSAPLKIVASSVPFHSPFGPDTWFGFPEERARIAHHVRSRGISGVLIVSGDLHLAWDLSSPSSGIHEFVAGPLAAPTFAQLFPQRVPSVEKLGRWHLMDAHNFGLVTVQRKRSTVEATIEIVDEHGRKHDVRRITVPTGELADSKAHSVR